MGSLPAWARYRHGLATGPSRLTVPDFGSKQHRQKRQSVPLSSHLLDIHAEARENIALAANQGARSIAQRQGARDVFLLRAGP